MKRARPVPPSGPRGAPRRRAIARQLRARRSALRSELRRRRRAARRELRRRRRAAHPQRRRWWLVLLLLLALLLLRDCSRSVPELPAAAKEPGPSAPVQTQPTVHPSAPAVHSGRVARRERPSFRSETQEPLPWLASFRLQVAARSLRLAECFVGAPRPGTLKWTAAVEPAHGSVSDQTLEPTLLSDALTRQQRGCVFVVLSDPPYQLESGAERSTPTRIGMVIEF